MVTFNFGTDEVKKQIGEDATDAKETIMGTTDGDEGGSLVSASVMAKGGSLPKKGKSFRP
jgi:hypothetical protein